MGKVINSMEDLKDWSVSDLYDLRDRVTCCGRVDNDLSIESAQLVSNEITRIIQEIQIMPAMRKLVKRFIEERGL